MFGKIFGTKNRSSMFTTSKVNTPDEIIKNFKEICNPASKSYFLSEKPCISKKIINNMGKNININNKIINKLIKIYNRIIDASTFDDYYITYITPKNTGDKGNKNQNQTTKGENIKYIKEILKLEPYTNNYLPGVITDEYVRRIKDTFYKYENMIHYSKKKDREYDIFIIDNHPYYTDLEKCIIFEIYDDTIRSAHYLASGLQELKLKKTELENAELGKKRYELGVHLMEMCNDITRRRTENRSDANDYKKK